MSIKFIRFDELQASGNTQLNWGTYEPSRAHLAVDILDTQPSKHVREAPTTASWTEFKRRLGYLAEKTNVAYVHVGSSRCMLVFVKDVLAQTWTLWVLNWTDNFFDLLEASSGRTRSSLIQGRCSSHVQTSVHEKIAVLEKMLAGMGNDEPIAAGKGVLEKELEQHQRKLYGPKNTAKHIEAKQHWIYRESKRIESESGKRTSEFDKKL